MDRTGRRLLVALGASALLHGWLAQSLETPGARRTGTPDAALLHAKLQHVPDDVPSIVQQDALRAAEPMLTPAPAADVPPVIARAATPSNIEAEREKSLADAARPRDAAVARAGHGSPLTQEVALAPPSDPTYYPARSLDRYPQALTALALGPATGAGTVRATVLIDEAGLVTDVRAVEAGAAEIGSAARDLLWRTRFTPAAREGRIVKAQLLISIDY